MKHLDSLNLLIDMAASIAGSDYALAKKLGVPRQHISAWRKGDRTATPADQALMAHVAGLDAVQTLARATVEQFEGRAKGDQLMRALGKALLVTGAAVGSAGASAAAVLTVTMTTSASSSLARFIQCIKARIARHNKSYVKRISA